MSRVAIILVVAVSWSSSASSQNQEYTTYFVEKNGYQVDFPLDWKVGVSEKQVAKRLGGAPVFTSALIGTNTNTPFAFVGFLSVIGCKNSKSDLKRYISIFEKDAKKNKDDKFLIHNQGEGEANQKEFNYVDYTYTFHQEDGNTAVVRRKFHTICHMYDKAPFSITFSFQAKEEDWDKVGPMFDKMFNSIKYKEK